MENYTHNFSPGMKITVGKIQILGIIIPTNGKYEDLIKLNYDEKKLKIKNIIQSWSKRSLTLFGKVTIIKSLIVPQLTYLLSVLPNPGQDYMYLKDIDSLIFNFLWDNKPPKIKREVILQKTNQGGLNITDIYTYSKSVKFQWVKKLLEGYYEIAISHI